jgi:hypothetical protein
MDGVFRHYNVFSYVGIFTTQMALNRGLKINAIVFKISFGTMLI